MKTIAVIVAALFAAHTASARPGLDTYRTSISTAGLNLASVKGVRALDLRLLHAATALCDMASAADAHGAGEARRCRDQALTTVAADRARIVAAAQRNAAQTAIR